MLVESSVEKWHTSERGVDEFVRRSLFPDQQRHVLALPYSYAELFRFVHTYEDKVRQLFEELNDIATHRGDDGTNDLFDALPLLGCEVFERVLECNQRGFDRFLNDFKKQTWVLTGELYIRMRLEEQLVHFAPSALRQQEDQL